jgi:hypothetical protein
MSDDNTIDPKEWPFVEKYVEVRYNLEFNPILDKYNLSRKEILEFNRAVLTVIRQFIKAGYK